MHHNSPSTHYTFTQQSCLAWHGFFLVLRCWQQGIYLPVQKSSLLIHKVCFSDNSLSLEYEKKMNRYQGLTSLWQQRDTVQYEMNDTARSGPAASQPTECCGRTPNLLHHTLQSPFSDLAALAGACLDYGMMSYTPHKLIVQRNGSDWSKHSHVLFIITTCSTKDPAHCSQRQGPLIISQMTNVCY